MIPSTQSDCQQGVPCEKSPICYYGNAKLEGKYTEWPNPQIRGENRQSGLTD